MVTSNMLYENILTLNYNFKQLLFIPIDYDL